MTVLGQTYWFLGDTGASGTVIRDNAHGLPKSGETVKIRSANGHLSDANLSQPIIITDPQTNTAVQAQVMLSPQCPTNLLGRDLITQLKLAIVPTVKGGLKVQRINETLVIEAEDSPITYWSLDVIPIAGPQDFTKYVVERAKNLIPPRSSMAEERKFTSDNVFWPNLY